jgi:arsenite methyltransferase
VISNGVVNLSAERRRVFAEVARVLRPGGRLALADIVTERRIAALTASQAELWAACIAGASQRELYLADTAAGLKLQFVQSNPGYRFTSERAQPNERQIRRAQHLAPGAQPGTWFPPALPPRFG